VQHGGLRQQGEDAPPLRPPARRHPLTTATHVLIHGAGDGGWYWHLLEAELHDRGHDVVAPDLPSDDDAAGLAEYADTVDDWWANTGYAQARREHDERNGAPTDDIALFLHDVPPDLAAEAMRRGRDQSATPGSQPWPLPAWPDVPTRFLLCRDDRFFPADFLRRVVQDRLAIAPDEIDGSHCVALSRPRELADRLESFRAEL
jgi:hypothetical protein